MATTTRPAATEEDLLRTPRDGRKYELVDGYYLQAGVPLVWVIDPKRRTAAAYRSLTDVRTLGPDDALDGADVVPGFRCALAEVVG